MDPKVGTEKYILAWRWPAIGIVVLAILAAIQLLRVNKPRPTNSPDVVTYSTPGPLITGELVIPERSFHSVRINLNRRAKLLGDFRTGDVKSRVSILVMREEDFDRWKSDEEHATVTKTGYVPGGRITPTLEPGVYFLVIDNRENDRGRTVQTSFILE